MHLSISTANFYRLPFAQTLDVIRRAGFESIELGAYWQGGDDWAAAQHLRDIPPRDVLAMVRDSGLRIATLHDMGGVIADGVDSLVAPDTEAYLQCGDGEIPCVVFHTPHKKTADAHWWPAYRPRAVADLRAIAAGRMVCVENMLRFPGYVVPLLDPEELLALSAEAGVYINIDSTHYAQCGVDIGAAADTLRARTRTVHLSDYVDGRAHVYVGQGSLDLAGFLRRLDLGRLHALTIECAIPYDEADLATAVRHTRAAREYVQGLLAAAVAGAPGTTAACPPLS